MALAAPGAGDPAPDFSLPAAGGDVRHLGELVAERSQALIFYRGAW